MNFAIPRLDMRRDLLLRSVAIGGAALLACASVALCAQPAKAYPDKPIRVIVNVPAGGTPDGIVRALVPALSGIPGQQFVIDNRTDPIANKPAEFADLIRGELESYAKLVKRSGIKID